MRRRGSAGAPRWPAAKGFRRRLRAALGYAEATGCKLIHVMAGLVHQGARRETFVANLKKAARKAAGAGVNLVIEPINRRDIPGYFLNKLAEARAIIYEVGEPNLGLQFDIYHRQVEDGDVAVALKESPPSRATTRSPIRPIAASRTRATSTTPGCCSRSTPAATRAGSAASTAPPRHGRGPRMGAACGVTLG